MLRRLKLGRFIPYDPQEHHRRSIRIQHIDYAQPGAYFVTCVTQNRICILSEIDNSVVSLKTAGEVVMKVWSNLPQHYAHLSLGDIVIMPNHIHAILYLGDSDSRTNQALPEIVRALKSYSARRINMLRSTPGTVFWQRNYYEHIVRDNVDLNRIREYIRTNPLQWELDQENPKNW